jgi:hypothetical protein
MDAVGPIQAGHRPTSMQCAAITTLSFPCKHCSDTPRQALARGRRLRNLNQQKLSAQRRAVQQARLSVLLAPDTYIVHYVSAVQLPNVPMPGQPQVFATRIQIWWRTFSSRVARQRRREAVEAAARQVLLPVPSTCSTF